MPLDSIDNLNGQNMDYLYDINNEDPEGESQDSNPPPSSNQDSHRATADLRQLQNKTATPQVTDADFEEVDQATISDEIDEFKQQCNELKTENPADDSVAEDFIQRADGILAKVNNHQISATQGHQELEDLKKERAEKLKTIQGQQSAEKKSMKEKLKEALNKISRVQESHNDLAFSRMGENAASGVLNTIMLVLAGGGWWAAVQGGGQVDENNRHEYNVRDKGVQVANALKGAIDTDDFSSAKELLRKMDRKDARVVVQFLVGAIHEEFGKDEQATVKALECLPADFRREMVTGALGDEKHLDQNEWNPSQQENEQRLFYFTAADAANLINRSLTKENLGEFGYLSSESNTSPESEEGGVPAASMN